MSDVSESNTVLEAAIWEFKVGEYVVRCTLGQDTQQGRAYNVYTRAEGNSGWFRVSCDTACHNPFALLRGYVDYYKTRQAVAERLKQIYDSLDKGLTDTMFTRLIALVPGGEEGLREMEEAHAKAVTESFKQRPDESDEAYMKRLGCSGMMKPAPDGGWLVYGEKGKRSTNSEAEALDMLVEGFED